MTLTIQFNTFSKIAVSLFLLLSLTGCGTATNLSWTDWLRQEYAKNGRSNRFEELHKQYDGSRLVLYWNKDKDQYWILNFIIWLPSLFIDIPEIVGMSVIVAIFYLVAWAAALTLTGGGILGVLARIGKIFGPIPFIAPVIMGVVFLGVIFNVVYNLVSHIWNGL